MAALSQESLEINELEESPSAHVFEATISNPRYVVDLLKAVHFKDTAIVFLNASGIKVTVEEAKSVQANSFIPVKIFQSFVLQEESLSFRINLTILLDCLQIFGRESNSDFTPSLTMSYDGYGSPLSLLVKENDVYTECSVTTYEPDDVVFFDFENSTSVNKIIMKSEYLKDAFVEMDTSSDYLQIHIAPTYFRMSTVSSLCSFHLECPQNSDVIEHFECTQEQSNKYNTGLMKPAAKALAPSNKVSIRTDDRGLLCLQFLIYVANMQDCFLEYFCLPNVDAE